MADAGFFLSSLCIQKQKLQEAAGTHVFVFSTRSIKHQFFVSLYTKRWHSTSDTTEYHWHRQSCWFLPLTDRWRNKNRTLCTGLPQRKTPTTHHTQTRQLWYSSLSGCLFAGLGSETANSSSNCPILKVRTNPSPLWSPKQPSLHTKVQINTSSSPRSCRRRQNCCPGRCCHKKTNSSEIPVPSHTSRLTCYNVSGDKRKSLPSNA